MSSLGNTCLSVLKEIAQVQIAQVQMAHGIPKQLIFLWHILTAHVAKSKPTLLGFLGQQTLVYNEA